MSSHIATSGIYRDGVCKWGKAGHREASTRVGKLWDLVEEWRADMQFPPSPRQIALAIGVVPSTFSGWRDGLSELPKRHNLWELHVLTNIPFEQLMEAAIEDAGLFDRDTAKKAAEVHRKGKSAGRAAREAQNLDATAPDPEGPETGA